MLILSGTSDELQLVLGGSTTTNAVQAYASARDFVALTGEDYDALPYTATASSTTPATIVGGLVTDHRRVIDFVSIRNADTVAASVTVRAVISSANFPLWSGTLQPGWTVNYVDGSGWSVLNDAGRPVTAQVAASASGVMGNPLFATANLTTAKTITSNSTFAVYVGRAPKPLASATIRLRVTTAAATITWAEVALATGAINVGGNPTLTVRGYVDVSAIVNSTGQKSISWTAASGQTINEGDDVWLLIGNQATTALAVRAQSIADDTQVGVQASLATRPSLNVGATQAYTIEGATTTAAWATLVI